MLNENRYRSETIRVRVTPEEKKIIKQKMLTTGEGTLTNYLRRLGLHGWVIHVDFSELREYFGAMGGVSREMRTIGHNINQIAKKANRTENFDTTDFLLLQKEFESLKGEVLSEYKRIIQRLDKATKKMEEY
ncbi:plasmid mobilization protein [Lactococcus garvieae]